MTPLLIFIPMIWAMSRRFDAVTITVALGMILSVAVAWNMAESQQHIGLAIIDFIVAGILASYVFYHVNDGQWGWSDKAHRAQVITIAACAKVTIWILYHTGGLPDWNNAATAANALLLYQILVAGGVGHGWVCRAYHFIARALRNHLFGGKDRGVA